MKRQTVVMLEMGIFVLIVTGQSVCAQAEKKASDPGKQVVPNASYYVADHTSVAAEEKKLPQKWIDKAAKLDVIFNHASVGNDIMRGLEDLARQNGKRYRLVLHSGIGWKEPHVKWFVKNNGFGDAKQGRNGHPKEKIDHFEGMIRGTGASKIGSAYEELGKVVDVGISKLGWADVNDGNLKQTFSDYRTAMEGLEKKYPKVAFVWCTLVITTKGIAAHEKYNNMIRKYVHGRNTDGNPRNNVFLFDIAAIQSHDPQGNPARVRGREALFEGYARDPGHLNEQGSRRAARGMYWLLARIAGWTGAP